MNLSKCLFYSFSAVLLLLFAPSVKPLFAQTVPTLGTVQSFAVLGAAAVTNTGPTILNGDLGVSPGTAITGFAPGIVNGTIHDADALAAQAQSDANTAYNFMAGEPCNTILSGQDLGGLTLVPGVYCYAATAQLTGTLTLDAQGNPNAVFIFKIGSSLTTASNAAVTLVNGTAPCNVFFQVGSSATLGTGTQFIGNIFALASITLTTNVRVTGRAIGLNGAVTMDSNVVSLPVCAVVPTNGFVQVCKVAGPGVAPGTNFTFSVSGTPVVVPAGAAPGGTCSPQFLVPTGPTVITETIPPGVTLTGVSTSPSGGLLISSNLAAGTATVTVTAGGQTIVTFIDAAIPSPPNGFVQVCKVAGAGIAAGTNYAFNVAGTPVTVPAGPAPNGVCSTPISVPPGAAVIAETIPAGTMLAGVSTLPSAGLLVSSNLATGTATVTVVSGTQTITTFIDAVIPIVPTNGFLQVCKVAGAGIAPGTNFTFSVAGTPVTIPAGVAPGGTCGAPIAVPAGTAVITETIPAATLVAGVGTLPSGLLVSSNLATGTVTVTVNAGGQTIVTFIDAATPMVPTNGFVQVCKVAGAGVAVGTNFAFNVAGTPVIVPAGVAPGGTCGAPVTVPAGPALITETLPAGTSLIGVSTLPSGALLISSNLGAGTATVTVTAGGQTIVTFIDAVTTAPPNGFLQVCKVAGAGVTVGTNFSFSVAGTPVTVAAGVAPGGTCGSPITVPPGVAIVTETIPAGTLLAGVSTLPSAGLLVSSNLATGTATVTVLPGGQTIVTFIDAATPPPLNGFVQVCKVAGAGVAIGTNFTFTVAGTQVTIPAGVAPGGTCGAPITVPAGTVGITETAVPGTDIAGIATLPPGLLVSSNLTAGTATVTVVSGGQTIVTFIDAIPTVPVGPAIVKAFGVPTILLGGSTSLSFTIVNPNAATMLSGVAFTDTLPGGLVISTPNGQMGACGGGTITAIAGSNIVSLTGATLAAGGACIFSVNVTGILAGPQTNSVTVTSTTAGTGNTSIVTLTVLSLNAFQKFYLSNLNVGGGVDDVINITNSGALGADYFGPATGTTGRICVNVYAFTADEQEQACCSCLVTPNALVHLSGGTDLIQNTLTGVVPSSVVVALLATVPGPGTTGSMPGTIAGPFTGSSCNPAYPFTAINLAPGMHAWVTTLHALPTAGPTYGVTESDGVSSFNSFLNAEALPSLTGPLTLAGLAMPSPGELAKLTGLCQFISGNGSGAGICKSCQLGGLGAGRR